MDTKLDLTKLADQYRDPDSAAAYLESIRWPDGPTCPHCGEQERSPYHITVSGKARRIWKCAECRKQFSVTVGTIFERSHIPLHKWLLAFHLLCASKKGMSSLQLSRMLGLTFKSAWFMMHRIRHAMPHNPTRMPTGVVDVGETYVGGRKRGGKRGRGTSKAAVAPLSSATARPFTFRESRCGS
jgi:transposase-like protein